MADSEKAWHSLANLSDGGVVSVHTACLAGSGFNPVKLWSPNHWIARNSQLWVFIIRITWILGLVSPYCDLGQSSFYIKWE